MLTILDDGSFSEPRSYGLSKLIVQFSEPVDPLTFTVASVQIAGNDANSLSVALGGIIIGVSLQSGDTEGVITFTPSLPDYARYIVRVSGVRDLEANDLTGDNDRIMTALVGDASGDLRVNSTDFSRVRSYRTQLIAPAATDEVRCDVSCDGRVNIIDLSRVRTCRGHDARLISDPVIP